MYNVQIFRHSSRLDSAQEVSKILKSFPERVKELKNRNTETNCENDQKTWADRVNIVDELQSHRWECWDLELSSIKNMVSDIIIG